MHCAVLPYVGQSSSGERWVDPGTELPGGFDNHVYVSASGVRALMQTLRWPLPGEFRELRADRDRLRADLDEARAEIAELRAFKSAIDAIESEGFRARRKPGRPKQEVSA